jgi:hypothetical protein
VFSDAPNYLQSCGIDVGAFATKVALIDAERWLLASDVRKTGVSFETCAHEAMDAAMAFVLRQIEGRAYEEVAAILGIPETTARVRVWRTRIEGMVIINIDSAERLQCWRKSAGLDKTSPQT